MRCLIIASLLGLATGAEASSRSPQPGEAVGTSSRVQASADSTNVATDGEVLPSRPLIREIGPPRNDEEREARDLSAQEAMADLAVWMVFLAMLQTVVSAIGLTFIWRTIRQGNQALAHARETAAVELRPYLLFTPIQFSSRLRESGARSWTITLRLLNSGQTPAFVLSCKFGFYQMDTVSQEALREMPLAAVDGKKGVVVGRDGDLSFEVNFSDRNLFDRNTGRPLKDLAVMVTVRYKRAGDESGSQYLSERGRFIAFATRDKADGGGRELYACEAAAPAWDETT